MLCIVLVDIIRLKNRLCAWSLIVVVVVVVIVVIVAVSALPGSEELSTSFSTLDVVKNTHRFVVVFGT